ncbi:hypothetical protein JMUB7546_26580 [Staphylococcus aureus]
MCIRDSDNAVRTFNLTEMQKPDSFMLKYGSNVGTEKRQQVLEDFKQYYEENGGILFQEFFKQKTAYEMSASLVGSEMCIRDRCYSLLFTTA